MALVAAASGQLMKAIDIQKLLDLRVFLIANLMTRLVRQSNDKIHHVAAADINTIQDEHIANMKYCSQIYWFSTTKIRRGEW